MKVREGVTMYPLGSPREGRKADKKILKELKKLFQGQDVRAFGLAVAGRRFQLYGISWDIIGVKGYLAPDLGLVVVVDDETQRRWADEVQRRTGVGWSQVGSLSARRPAAEQVLGINIPSDFIEWKVVRGCSPTPPDMEVLLVTEEYLNTLAGGYSESMRSSLSPEQAQSSDVLTGPNLVMVNQERPTSDLGRVSGISRSDHAASLAGVRVELL